MKYYGVIVSSFTQTYSLIESECDYKPMTESCSWFTCCKWFKTKKEQLKFTKYAEKHGHKKEEIEDDRN